MSFASLSLDLDNLWSYLKTRGDDSWKDLPTFLDTVVPRALEFLDEHSLKVTFFIVGQDADRDENRSALAAIAAAGHEIGNHSYQHEPWLHRYSERELEEELERAEIAIESATGVRPRGFRGPGYSLSRDALRVLARRGYAYDASTLPTFMGPLARRYYFRAAELDEQESAEREQLFGSVRDGLQPLKSYTWTTCEGSIVEIPVTTFPIMRTPIHVSYLMYAAKLSASLSAVYFRAALAACRATRTPPSILLHPLDFLGSSDADSLGFFPGMDMTLASKRRVLDDTLRALARSHEVVTMAEHATRIRGTRLRERSLEPS